MPGTNVVQSVGSFTATYANSALSLLGGATIAMKGFKLEDTFVTSDQELDNAKNVPLVDGGVITLVNSQKAGRITINALHFSDDPLQGDITALGLALQDAALSVGGVIRFTSEFNGVVSAITFFNVTLARVPPIMIAGNDIPTYPVVFAYQYWQKV